ncbi:WYL domain-containing protein [Kribbella sp. NBC_01245]|uniref:helix-turn-helix transcriptional regulator n=1 Tax=Kribbella sp. NBC_01245 TaxID=2903578 RepID=UPI002E2C881A|nr:WYL domain-containing protein [Kribbella sp. NBC_01245]
MDEASPTAKALLALELIQDNPGISGDRLGLRLGVSDRAARRYVGTLRDAGIPIESTPGRYGGYRVGRGFRLPPLMFSTAEALGLMMAALEGQHSASDTNDPAGRAIGKILRVLPTSVAAPAEAIRKLIPAPPDTGTNPDPEITAVLVQSCVDHHRVRLGYQLGDRETRTMYVDPWAVAVRHGRWYLLGWSHTKDARRVLRVDRVVAVDPQPETFVPPDDLDPIRTIEEHLAEGWKYPVEIVIDAPIATVGQWIARNLGRLEAIDEHHTRLIGSTEEPEWYARRITSIDAPFHIIGPEELAKAVRTLGERLTQSSAPQLSAGPS